MRSVYVLDLAHPLLLGKDSTVLTVVFNSASKLGKVNFISGFYEAAIVVSELKVNYTKILEKIKETWDRDDDYFINSGKRSYFGIKCEKAYDRLLKDAQFLLPPLKLLDPIAADLLKIHSLGMGPILKEHVYSYAIMLLSNHWEDLERKRDGVSNPISAVMTAIQMNCSLLLNVAERGSESRSNGALLIFIYALAHHLAIQLQHILKRIEHRQSVCDFATAAFLLKPSKYLESECWQLKVYFRLSDVLNYLDTTEFKPISVNLSLPKELDLLARE